MYSRGLYSVLSLWFLYCIIVLCNPFIYYQALYSLTPIYSYVLCDPGYLVHPSRQDDQEQLLAPVAQKHQGQQAASSDNYVAAHQTTIRRRRIYSEEKAKVVAAS